MRPIEFLGTVFFDLMRVQPEGNFYSTSLSQAFAMVKLDMKDKQKKNEDTSMNEAHLKTLKYIEENTHKDLKMPLAIAEAIVASTEKQKWNKESGSRNNAGDNARLPDGSQLRVIDIYRLLKESYTPIVEVVCDIIQPYTMEYRMTVDSGSYMPSFLGGKQ